MGCELWLTSQVSVSSRRQQESARFSFSIYFCLSHISSPWKGAQEVCMCVWMYINMVANKITGHEWMDDAEKEHVAHVLRSYV